MVIAEVEKNSTWTLGRVKDIWVLTIKEPLNVDESEYVRKTYQEKIQPGSNLIVNFEEDCYRMEDCISFLLSAQFWVTLDNGSLVIIPNDHIRKKIEVSGLTPIFRLANDVEDAVNLIEKNTREKVDPPK